MSYSPRESEDGEAERDLILPDDFPGEAPVMERGGEPQPSFPAQLGSQLSIQGGSLGERPEYAALTSTVCVLFSFLSVTDSEI